MGVSRDNTIDTGERSARALIIIDMINALDFDGGEQLLPAALDVAPRIAALKQAARAARIPVIYANDNFGRWRSDFRDVYENCCAPHVVGRPLAEQLPPQEQDYFVLKPKQSAFYATPLEVLLRQLDARELIMTGIAGDGCVLVSAYDAHLREYRVRVPEDCIASQTRSRTQRALQLMRSALHVDTTPSGPLLAALADRAERDAA